MSESIYSAGRTAAASCRQLGYGGVLDAGSRVGKIDNVSVHINCTPNSEFVRSCGRGDATCNEHVFVFCRFGSVKPFDVRLRNSSVPSRGIVEFLYESEWLPVCFDWSYQAKLSDAACKHLGYGKGKSTLSSSALGLPCLDTRCNGSCESIHEFVFSFFSLGSYRRRALVFTCQNSDWSIRLVNGFGGTKQSEGRVEVHLNQTWRVVCDSKWNINDSIVVCRQLGYGEPILAKRRFPATMNDVMIYTNGRRCKGNEMALSDCISFIEDPNEACEEVVVRCEERRGVANVDLFVIVHLNNILGCPRGWFIYAGYCYFLSYSKLAFTHSYWNLRLGQCGRSLLSISSSHEHAFVIALLAELESKGELSGNDVWIGLGRNRDSQFRWNNEELLRYSALQLHAVKVLIECSCTCSRAMWARGEPSADPTRACVAMNSRTGYWKTADCLSEKQMLCKVALGMRHACNRFLIFKFFLSRF